MLRDHKQDTEHQDLRTASRFILAKFSFQSDAVLRLSPDVHHSGSLSYKVVGYYADWTAERYPLADIPADKLTHVNYAFGKIDADNG